ncbi:hypothetical protein P3T36_000251 [Kitasatospora sp. MAP12-15]|uniref:hypothetical protein n=1 Tax=unclassified Kitasatospora TaxID=2633591 RepID=UPI0024758910|nr:hypothetical protein [Kitasatospora sp. MAP12-44]MDH6109480.1 hypothetical protein [Kitasatospora sp. MAP12-44]
MTTTNRAPDHEPPAPNNPLDDYDPQLAARASRRPTASDWPRCECGAAHCPDRDLPA